MLHWGARLAQCPLPGPLTLHGALSWGLWLSLHARSMDSTETGESLKPPRAALPSFLPDALTWSTDPGHRWWEGKRCSDFSLRRWWWPRCKGTWNATQGAKWRCRGQCWHGLSKPNPTTGSPTAPEKLVKFTPSHYCRLAWPPLCSYQVISGPPALRHPVSQPWHNSSSSFLLFEQGPKITFLRLLSYTEITYTLISGVLIFVWWP